MFYQGRGHHVAWKDRGSFSLHPIPSPSPTGQRQGPFPIGRSKSLAQVQRKLVLMLWGRKTSCTQTLLTRMADE